MPMSIMVLRSGDRVLHPMYGFGVVEGLITSDKAGQKTDYYGIRLSEGHGAMLSVPVARAEALGLRLIINGLATIVACLRSPAHPLPDNDRQRLLELKACWQAPEPTALTRAVRDLLNRRHTRRLTPADKKWLAHACERLSTEAALVDSIGQIQAQTAIQQEIDRLLPSKTSTPAPDRTPLQRNKSR
jgi:RNA polymerase-interacting CarD/CdnL/TRCF family regulator